MTPHSNNPLGARLAELNRQLHRAAGSIAQLERRNTALDADCQHLRRLVDVLLDRNAALAEANRTANERKPS